MKYTFAALACLIASAGHSVTFDSVTQNVTFAPFPTSVTDTSGPGLFGGTTPETDSITATATIQGFSLATAGVTNATLTKVTMTGFFEGVFATSIAGNQDGTDPATGRATFDGLARIRAGDLSAVLQTFDESLTCTAASPTATSCTRTNATPFSVTNTVEYTQAAALTRFMNDDVLLRLSTQVKADLEKGTSATAALLLDDSARPRLSVTYEYSLPDTPAVPLPASAWFLVAGLTGFAAFGRKKRA